MKKNKNFCKLLSTLLAIVLILSGTRLSAFASDGIAYEVICIDECGDISYETIPTISEELLDCSSNGIVVLHDTPSTLQADDTLATPYSTSLEDVSLLTVTFAPYKYMCLIQATFPDGTRYRSSGILISKNLVLASAHGIYQQKYGGAATSVAIGVGTYFSGSEEIYKGGVQLWSGGVVNKGWATNETEKDDWSLIKLSQNVDSYQRCGYVADFTEATNREVRLIGYANGNSFKTSVGTITGTTNNLIMIEKWKNLWTISAEACEGMSGGPVIQKSDDIVIGVYVGNRNLIGTTLANPLTKEIADTILKYAEW